MIKRFKHWLARGVMWFWRKESVRLAVAWSWLMRNGNGNNNGPEPIDKYTDDQE